MHESCPVDLEAIYHCDREREVRRSGLFVVESEPVVRRLLATDFRVHSILVGRSRVASLADMPLGDVPIHVVDDGNIKRIRGYEFHDGIIAAVHRPDDKQLTIDAALGHLRNQASFVLVLAEGVTNVDNIGSLFRNAAVFGADGVVLASDCCDPLYRKAVRVSMGHALTTPWALSRNWTEDLDRLKSQWDMTLIGADNVPGAVPLWEVSTPSRRIGIVLGSERHGMSPEAMSACDEVAQLPMATPDGSLNVAVASAVFLYELACRRRDLDVDGRTLGHERLDARS